MYKQMNHLVTELQVSTEHLLRGPDGWSPPEWLFQRQGWSPATPTALLAHSLAFSSPIPCCPLGGLPPGWLGWFSGWWIPGTAPERRQHMTISSPRSNPWGHHMLPPWSGNSHAEGKLDVQPPLWPALLWWHPDELTQAFLWDKGTEHFSLFFFLATPHSLQYLSSLTRDWTWALENWRHGVLTTGAPGKSPEDSKWELKNNAYNKYSSFSPSWPLVPSSTSLLFSWVIFTSSFNFIFLFPAWFGAGSQPALPCWPASSPISGPPPFYQRQILHPTWGPMGKHMSAH